MADLELTYNIKTIDQLINAIQETQNYITSSLGEKINTVQYWITELNNLNTLNEDFDEIKELLNTLEAQTEEIETAINEIQNHVNVRFFQNSNQVLPSNVEDGAVAFIES